MKNNLDEVREFLDEIPAINWGGCGIAAYSMYLWMQKHNLLCEDFCFVFLYSFDECYNHNCNVLLQQKKNLVVDCHIILQNNGILFDSDTYFKKIPRQRFHLISDVEMLKNCLKTDTWNDAFYREKYIPIIEKELEIDLEDVKRVVYDKWI